MSVVVIEVNLSPENAAAKAAELAASIQKIKDQQTILNATNQKASQEYANNTAKLKTLTQEQKAYTTIAKEAVGSNNQLRAQLTLLTNQYNALGKAERDTTTAGKALLAQTRAISDELKRNEKAVGDNRRNVGNYRDVLSDLSPELGMVVGKVAQMGAAISSLGGIVLTTSGTLRVLKVAMIGTGIGALIVALGSLIAYFTQTERGAEQLERIMGGLKGAFQVILKPLTAIGESLVNAFTNPKQAAMDLLDFMKNQLFNRFKAFMVLWDGLKTMDFNKFNKGLFQLATGVENVTGKVSNFGKELGKGFAEGANVAKLKQDAEDIVRDLNTKASKFRADAAVLRAKGDAESLKQAEALFKKADKLTQDAVNSEIKAQNALIKMKEAAGTARDEDYQAQSDLYAKIDQSRQTDAAKAEKINTRLEKLAEAERARIEKLEEAVKKKQKAQNDYFDDVIKGARTQLANLKLLADAEVKERETIAEKIKTINEKNLDRFQKNADQMEVLIAERLQAQTDLAQAGMFASTDAERLQANQTYLDAKYQQDIDNAIRTGKDTTLITAGYTRDQETINLQKDRAVTDSFDAFSENFQNTVGKNTQAAKIAADVQARIDAASQLRNNVLIIQENLKALAKQGQLIFPFNIIAIFSTLAALASAAGNAKTIFSVPGFAGGGFVSDGKGSAVKGIGTSKSDSIPARLSTGESVINARSTEMFAPILSQINQAGGGRAFDNVPRSGFASGGIANGSYITGLSETSQQANQMNALMNTLKMLPPPIVDVRQIILESQKFAATQVRQNI